MREERADAEGAEGAEHGDRQAPDADLLERSQVDLEARFDYQKKQADLCARARARVSVDARGMAFE